MTTMGGPLRLAGANRLQLRADAEHRQAAEDFDRAADLHAARARAYRRAAFLFGQRVPIPTAYDRAIAELMDRWPCDND